MIDRDALRDFYDDYYNVLDDVRLDEIVAAEVERARRHAPGVRFRVTREPTTVRGDVERLRRAVSNVLANAAKWSPAGGLVEIVVVDGVVSVRDHGPGFSAADLPFVFERFYRSDRARAGPGVRRRCRCGGYRWCRRGAGCGGRRGCGVGRCFGAAVRGARYHRWPAAAPPAPVCPATGSSLARWSPAPTRRSASAPCRRAAASAIRRATCAASSRRRLAARTRAKIAATASRRNTTAASSTRPACRAATAARRQPARTATPASRRAASQPVARLAA